MANSEEYEVIVIGAGLGGLTAAALLAKAGRQVLVVEKEERVGGYFGPIVQGKYSFNNGPRLLMGCNAGGPYGPGVTYQLLDELGARDLVEFIQVQPFVSIRYPDLELKLWSGRENFVEGLNKASPGGLERLPELLEVYRRLHNAGMFYYTAKRPWGLMRGAGELAGTLPYQNATMESVLSRYLPQGRARTLAGALWPYLALPPWRASFIYWASLMAIYIDEGGYFCKGGLHQLSGAVASALQRDGGELLTGTAVHRILVEQRQARGVELVDGRKFLSKVVIADIDPRRVFGELIEAGQRPASYLRKLGRMELSARGLNLSLVTDLDLPRLGFGYETLVIENWDARQTWQELEAGKPGVFGLTMMDAADPDLAPPGQHLVSLFGSLPSGYKPSPENLRRTAENLLAAAEKHAPGLASHLVWAGSGEAAEGYLAKLFEPIYGWSSAPRHSALRRLGPWTPVKGLILAGQWTQPGQGAPGVILSGREAARIVGR
jgi:phytoene dehydrogenase-like protein